MPFYSSQLSKCTCTHQSIFSQSDLLQMQWKNDRIWNLIHLEGITLGKTILINGIKLFCSGIPLGWNVFKELSILGAECSNSDVSECLCMASHYTYFAIDCLAICFWVELRSYIIIIVSYWFGFLNSNSSTSSIARIIHTKKYIHFYLLKYTTIIKRQ